MNSSGIASVMNDHINDSKTIVFTNSPPDMKSFTFPQVMRWTGSLMLICAGVFFMIQGFDSISFLTRHWIFTSIVFSMGGLGLFTGLKLKEIRGARVLLGLSAALIPVLFSQMGALVQSVLPQSQVSLPKAIMAEPESPLIILITTISTIALIVPVVFFGFKVLAHSRSSVLSLTYLLLNAILLIPGRNPSLSGALFLLMTVLVAYIYNSYILNSSILSTIEGKLSTLMIFSPIAIIASRALFYNTGLLYFGFLFAGAGVLLLNIQYSKHNDTPSKSFQKTGGVLFLMAAIPLISWPIFKNVSLPSEIVPFTIILPELLLIAYVTHLNSTRRGETARMIAAIVTLVLIAINHLICTTTALSIMTTVTGILLIALSVGKKECVPFHAGLLCTAGGVTGGLWSALQFQSQSIWILFAIIGITALISATLSEMYKTKLQNEFVKWNWIWKGKHKSTSGTVTQ